MTRTTAREIAVLLSYSAASGGDAAEALLERFFEEEHYATLAPEGRVFEQKPDERQMEYIRSLVSLTEEHRAALDADIERFARGWKLSRISRMAATILRCAMCEILYVPDVPTATAIDEAVELAKRYEDADAASFINGILGSFVRAREEAPAAEADAEE